MFTKCAQNGKKSNKKKAASQKAKSLPMQIASSMATKDFAGYFEQAVFQPALHSRNMCTKPRNMRTASRKITRGFDDYSEQAVFQPALHSRILQKKATLLRASLFVIQNDGFRYQSYNNRGVAAK